jgi:phosphoribosylglycinamide formyltransferase-1
VVRTAVLASGEGAKLQAILDARYFNEIANMELVAVICPERGCGAMKRALSAEVPAYFVDPELFPTITSHSMAVANKLRDMDIELVILADYSVALGVIPYQFKNRMIATYPALYPAFEDMAGEEIQRLVLERGLKVTGATAYFVDGDGRVSGIILQKALDVLPGDDPESLGRRILEECEWPLLTRSVAAYCAGELQVRGKRVRFKPVTAEQG